MSVIRPVLLEGNSLIAGRRNPSRQDIYMRAAIAPPLCPPRAFPGRICGKEVTFRCRELLPLFLFAALQPY
jgi:hypothetical protein